MSAACPLYTQEMDKVLNDFDVQQLYAQFSSVFEYIEKNTNLEMGKKEVISSTILLYDSLFVEVNTKLMSIIFFLLFFFLAYLYV